MITDTDLESLKDRYEFICELGTGGMSIVYKARDKTLDRLVALKTLSVKSLSEKQMVQFQAEARALSNLKHKSIMEILDFGSTKSGKPYMVLEYIEGIPLSKYIENVGPLPLILCLQIFNELCEGLNHAHNKGVLHRDIKPSNIILVSSGKEGYTPKIIDFGLAVLQSNEAVSNIQDSAAGSPPYMSPEQIEGKVLDQRSDIYSLGCTLFESLTGKVPYKGANAFETMNMHKTMPVPNLPKISSAPEIQNELQASINKSLAKNKAERYQFVVAFKKTIEEILARSLEFAKVKSSSHDSNQSVHLFKRKNSYNWIYVIGALVAGISVIGYFISQEYTKKNKHDLEKDMKNSWYQDNSLGKSTASIRKYANKKLKGEEIAAENLDKYPDDTKELNLELQNLAQIDFTILKRMRKLDKLVLTACELVPQQLKQIATLTSLTKLKLDYNDKLKDADFSALSLLKNLRKLEVQGCGLNRKPLLHISKIKSLKELNLEECQGIDEEVITNLAKLPRLKELKIGINHSLKGETLRALGKFKDMPELNLDALEIDDAMADYLSKKLTGVEKLSVGHTFITLKGLGSFLHMPNLKKINISGCKNLQDDESQEGILYYERTLKRIEISQQSRMLKS